MRTLKKIISTTLVFIIFIICVSSCGNEKDSSQSLIPEELLELEVWDTQGTDHYSDNIKDNVVENWFVSKTNVKVTNIFGNDGGQWDTKLTKLMASGTMPHIMYCGSGQGTTHFAKLDAMDQVWELTPELLKKYAPNMWNKLPESVWEKVKVNDKILGIPFSLPVKRENMPNLTNEEYEFLEKTRVVPKNDVMVQQTGYLYIRDDILQMFYPEAKSYDELCEILAERQEPIGEELLDIPIYTTEEYIDFMYDIKNKGLTENGNPVYAFGYTGGDNWEALAWLGADMYGYKGHYYTSTWNDSKQEIEIPLVGDMIRQAAKTQNKMLNDKVIDPESMAHNMKLFEEKVLNGQYAICAFSTLGDTEKLNQKLEEMGKDFRYRPFITQVPAQNEYGAFAEEQIWHYTICLLKTLSEEELLSVLNWLNVQFSDEYEEIINWGPPEANLYKESGDGKREFIDERFTEYFIKRNALVLDVSETKGLQGSAISGWRFCHNTGKWDPDLMARYIYLRPTCDSGFKFPKNSEHVKNVKEYPPCQVWSPEYADIPEVVEFWSRREEWESEFKAAMTASPLDFDKKWSSAVNSLNEICNTEEMAKKMTEKARQLIMADK